MPSGQDRGARPVFRRLVHEVRSICFGDDIRYENGRLVVSVNIARGLLADDAFSDVRIALASPGARTRIVKVLDAVEPRVKVSGPIFPGWLDDPATSETGSGDTHVLRGAAVVSAGFLPRAQEAVVDMSGPAAALSPLSQTHNVVVEFEPAAGASWEDVEAALRRGVLRLAKALAEAAADTEPDREENLTTISRAEDPELPAIGTITNLQTQGAFKDVFVFGRSFSGSMPRAIDPADLEDGAVVSGQYGHPGLKNPTILFQNHPVASALHKRHGKDLRFAGVILSPEPVEQDRKEVVSAAAVDLCKKLGWDGCIVTKEGGGNADSDMALKMDAAENAGIKAVGLFAEMSGRQGDGPPVVGPPAKATGMVSTGNYDERIRLPEMDTALGGSRLEVAGADATSALEIPTAVILGSLNPLGWGRLTAVPASEVPSEGRAQNADAEAVPGAGRPNVVVHYINQFFAGIGGEEEAGRGPGRLETLPPISRKLQSLLGDDFEVRATVYCGDDYAASNPGAADEILSLMASEGASMVIAGPAFSSGRYGIAVARVASAAAAAGLAAICGMHPENPGLGELKFSTEGLRPQAIATGTTAREMTPALEALCRAATRVARGEQLSPDDGLIAKPVRRNSLSERNAAERAVDLILARLRGDETATEIPLSDFGVVTPAPPLTDPASAIIALLSEGGLVPVGNPGRLESARATKWLRYPLEGKQALAEGEFGSVHGGFSTVAADADPNRILPLDAARELEGEGRIGRLFGEFFVTVGNGTPVARANRFGVEWAAELRQAGVQAAILTST